jgi:RNA polymerase sigma-70 factor, ECF subfamily
VGRLYDVHGAGLYRYALMLLADPAAAEDAVHAVFAALLKPGAAVPGNEAHYLRRAVRNECFSLLRRRRVRAEAGEAPLLEAVAPGTGSPDERLALEAALRDLPPEQREVVHLHVYEGLTFQEVADAAGESINTVAARYRYALAKLRQALK